MTDETIWDQEPYNKAYEKCPAENCPEFKQCQMCQECHILKAWQQEQSRRFYNEHGYKPCFITRAASRIKDVAGYLLVVALTPYYLIKIITADHK